jgi:hypothetical protein
MLSQSNHDRRLEKWQAWFDPPVSPQASLQTAIEQPLHVLTCWEDPDAAEQHRVIQRLIDLLAIDLAPFQGCQPDRDRRGLVLHKDGTPLPGSWRY